MKRRPISAGCTEQTKTMDYVVFQIAEFPSLCSLCLCALCVQRRLRGHALLGIDLCCSGAAFDTEVTEAQRTQRNFGYFSSGLSKPFLRYLRTCRTQGERAWVACEPTPELPLRAASRPAAQARFMRRRSREAR